MGLQADYEKAKAEAWKEYHKHVVCGTDSHRYWFDKTFNVAYFLGKAHADDHIPEATKKVDRAMIAAMAMQGLLNATSVERFTLRIKPSTIAEAAIEYADALITELGKERE